MSLDELLVWLTGGGAVLAASWLLERISWYQNIQKPDTKQMIFYGVCLLFSLGAFAVQNYVPAETLEQLRPWFMLIISTFGSVFLGTQFHKTTKLDDKGNG